MRSSTPSAHAACPVTTIDKEAEALEKGSVSGGELLSIDRGPMPPPLTPRTRRWISAPPRWLHVSSPAPRSRNEITSSENPTFSSLGRGEHEAIRLAVHEEARLLVIDERAGRVVAQDLGLNITGRLGGLDVAGTERLIDVGEVIDRLRATSFRAIPTLYRWPLKQHER